MSFDDLRQEFQQEHFTVVELELPYVTSCTAAAGISQGYNTPLTCEEDADSTYTVYLATRNLPLEYGHPSSSGAGQVELPSDNVHPVVLSISEKTTELRPGNGLSLTGTLNITIRDFDGDPGPVNSTSNGTYLGKLRARNVLENKKITIRQFHVNSQNRYSEEDSQDREYLIDTIVNNSNGTWTISGKDPLSASIEGRKGVFPAVTGGSLRSDINNSVTSIPVDQTTDWEQIPVPYTIIVGDELMKVTAVSNNQTSSASLTVNTRGTSIAFTNALSTSSADEHDNGDDVQICHTSDQERVDRLLQEICYVGMGLIIADYYSDEGSTAIVVGDLVEVSSGHTGTGTPGNVYKRILNPATVSLDSENFTSSNWEDMGVRQADIKTWKDEIDEWHSSTGKIDTIIIEPRKANNILSKVLNDFLLDMWWDPISKLVKISAISVWKVSSGTVLAEGKHIDHRTLKLRPKTDNQFTRAFIFYNKPNKTEDDGPENFRGLSVNIDSDAEELYGETITKSFDPSIFVKKDQADLLVQRTVSRFSNTPNEYSWVTQEKFLDFSVGEVRTLSSPEIQDADGNELLVRCQILSIQPRYTNFGREYSVKALSYESAAGTSDGGSTITITGTNNEINLYTEAGAPSGDVDITFVFDNATITSDDSLTPSVRAGGFSSGSSITIICINGTDWQAAGGNAGYGAVAFYDAELDTVLSAAAGDGGDGGICYDSEGIDTDIYLDGADVSGYTPDGYLRAPGGGGGGGGGGRNVSDDEGYGGGGGGGGGGNQIGSGGNGGNGSDGNGSDGNDGDSVGNGGSSGSGFSTAGNGGNGGDWGSDGSDGIAGTESSGGIGGSSGKAIVTTGSSTVNVYDDDVVGRFIRGSGDLPDNKT